MGRAREDGTSALVPAWCPFSDKEKIIYRGLAEKVFTAGHIRDVDNTYPASISRAHMQDRRMSDAYRRALAEFAPADISPCCSAPPRTTTYSTTTAPIRSNATTSPAS